MRNTFAYTFLVGTLLFFNGCSHYQFDKSIKNPNLPTTYNDNKAIIDISNNWINELHNEDLLHFTKKALNSNRALKTKFYDIKIKEQELISTKSLLFPSVDLQLNQNNDGQFDSSASTTSTNAQLNASYELDLWGKLDDDKKSANMQLLQTKALYEDEKQKLINDISVLYYEIISITKLQELHKNNISNAKNNLKIVHSKYNQGLVSIQDIYEAKQTLFVQQQKLSQDNTNKKQTVYQLEKLLGSYPKGLINIEQELPVIKNLIKKDTPEDLILRKPSIQAAWSNLLSKDYTLAFKHKQRLPSLTINASLEDSLDGTPLSWSLLGSITAPIFNASDLKAKEKVAMYEVKQAELAYLDAVYETFLQIENLIVAEKNLKEEYHILLHNHSNAQKSYALAQNEYIKGLNEYINVLTSQQNYFNAKESLINIKMQIIQNRVNLQYALAQDFNNQKNAGNHNE